MPRQGFADREYRICGKFMGFAGLNRHFIKDFTKLSSPIHRLLEGHISIGQKKGEFIIPLFYWT